VLEITDGVFVATADQYTTTTTIVAGADGGCLLIDPAVSVADLAWLAGWLAERGLRAVAGWSTHPHWDHVLWSAALGDVPRYATHRAAEFAARDRARFIERVEDEAPGHDLALLGRVSPLHRVQSNRVEPDRGELHGVELDWAGPRTVIYAHDAHAPGHGAVFLPDSGVLITGDMCSDIEIPLLDLESADPFGGYRHGLGLLAAIDGVAAVVPGHGHPCDRAEFHRRVAADLAYLDAVEAGDDIADPRLTAGWLIAEHAKQRALAR
jgi:hydroxyacylglutathione hydrolase